MAIQENSTLKGYFNTGDKPTQQNFYDLIETARPEVVALDSATLTLTAAQSGTTFIFDGTAAAVTLPTAAAGLFYDFLFHTTQAADGSITTETNDKISGGFIKSTAALNVTNLTNTTSVIDAIPATTNTLTFNGTTTGGVIGSHIRILGMAALKWHVSGFVIASGTIVTSAS